MFLIRFANKLTAGVIRFFGRLSTAISVLLILLITAAYFADRYFAGGYYSAYFISGGINTDGALFFEYSSFSETHPVLNFIIIVAFFAFVNLLKILLRFFFTKIIKKYSVINRTIHLAFIVFLNMTLVAAFCVIVLNGMIVTYVRSFTGGGNDFKAQTDFVAAQIINDQNLSTVALQKIIFNFDKDPQYISTLTFDEHLKLCEEVNRLMDLRGGPQSPEEHYLRNRLNYAPQNLDAMLSEIKNPSGVSWILLSPGQSAYHMFGSDGEYNLKFVSADGFFEAVYNKNGELLTEENDAVNMGTYNYADPVTRPQKHSTYDVLPYYEWGNTADSQAALEEYNEDDVSVIFESQEKFENNPEARERYNYYKSLTEGK